MQNGAGMRAALSCRFSKIGTFGAQNENGQRCKGATLGSSVLLNEELAVKGALRSGNRMELKTKHQGMVTADSEQISLEEKAEALVGVMVKEDHS